MAKKKVTTRRIGRGGKYDSLITRVSPPENYGPKELVDYFKQNPFPNLQNNLSIIEQGIDTLKATLTDESQQQYVDLALHHTNETRSFVKVNNAEMAAFHALLAAHNYHSLFVTHWEEVARIGEALKSKLPVKEYTKEEIINKIDQLCNQYTNHNITWIRNKLSDDIGLSFSQIKRVSDNYNPLK